MENTCDLMDRAYVRTLLHVFANSSVDSITVGLITLRAGVPVAMRTESVVGLAACRRYSLFVYVTVKTKILYSTFSKRVDRFATRCQVIKSINFQLSNHRTAEQGMSGHKIP